MKRNNRQTFDMYATRRINREILAFNEAARKGLLCKDCGDVPVSKKGNRCHDCHEDAKFYAEFGCKHTRA
jgi:hypothetical protein